MMYTAPLLNFKVNRPGPEREPRYARVEEPARKRLPER